MSLRDRVREKEINYKDRLDDSNRYIYLTYCENLHIPKKEYSCEYYYEKDQYINLFSITKILDDKKYNYSLIYTENFKRCINSYMRIMYLNLNVEDNLTCLIRSVGEELRAYYICMECLITYRVIELCTGISILIEEK